MSRVGPLVLMVMLMVLTRACPAQAQPDPVLQIRALAANCAGCHGTQGRAAADSLVSGLAGMPAPYFIAQMRAFESGARQGTLMPQLAKGFSDAQIVQLAQYFAALKGVAK